MTIRKEKHLQFDKNHDLVKNFSDKAPSINDSTMDEGRHDSLYTDPKLSHEAFSDIEPFAKEGKFSYVSRVRMDLWRQGGHACWIL